MSMNSIVNDFRSAITGSAKKTGSYDSKAKVIRVDQDTAWVHIYGGIDETPVQMSISAKEGDEVRVRVSDGRAWIVGNDTAPPVGNDTVQDEVKKAKKKIKKDIDEDVVNLINNTSIEAEPELPIIWDDDKGGESGGGTVNKNHRSAYIKTKNLKIARGRTPYKYSSTIEIYKSLVRSYETNPQPDGDVDWVETYGYSIYFLIPNGYFADNWQIKYLYGSASGSPDLAFEWYQTAALYAVNNHKDYPTYSPQGWRSKEICESAVSQYANPYKPAWLTNSQHNWVFMGGVAKMWSAGQAVGDDPVAYYYPSDDNEDWEASVQIDLSDDGSINNYNLRVTNPSLKGVSGIQIDYDLVRKE